MLGLFLLLFCAVHVNSRPLTDIPSLYNARRFDLPLFDSSSVAFQPSFLSQSSPIQSTQFTTYTSGSAFAEATNHRKSSSLSTSPAGEQSFSIIGTLPPLPPTSTSPVTTTTSSVHPEPSVTLLTSASSNSRAVSRWRPLTIGLIAIASVATMAVLTVFFESWLGCLQDRYGRNEGESETMVPDSAEKTWRLKLSTEAGHRYPAPSNSPNHLRDATPKPHLQPSSDFLGYDRHPLEPVFRRPSIRTPVINTL
ncbi:hypothetical protein D9757_010849 [Collybiopsis confluens]|uniref:Transmembrane protein n=1 Tax=Collybiopsis confluens TaxID=2823264 RepID=A0A8H5LRJ7_9AGAR|nr:hypothetical protein D9757_010849 [Collybiopsis confluens]